MGRACLKPINTKNAPALAREVMSLARYLKASRTSKITSRALHCEAAGKGSAIHHHSNYLYHKRLKLACNM